MKISILDSSVCATNLGNQIIMESVNLVLDELFGEDFILRLPHLERFGKLSLNHMRTSKYTFFGGTNALTSNMIYYSQMGFGLSNYLKVNNLILFGVGWWQYQKKPNLYTKILLRKLLHSSIVHSVRDEYTSNNLKEMGVINVLNTSCPSTWCLTKERIKRIPKKKSEHVVFTLTDYKPSMFYDRSLIALLAENYNKCFFWPQGLEDMTYLKNLSLPKNILRKIVFISPRIESFDNILTDYSVDYVGTRLHAGIRSLQYSQRSLILAVDNRAKEMSKDIGLLTCDRDDMKSVKCFIDAKNKIIKITLPQENILKWKRQFTL